MKTIKILFIFLLLFIVTGCGNDYLVYRVNIPKDTPTEDLIKIEKELNDNGWINVQIRSYFDVIQVTAIKYKNNQSQTKNQKGK